MEAEITSIPADFEIGDRAYYEDIDGIEFATVTASSETEIGFQLDSGLWINARLNADPQSIEDVSAWWKPLPLDRVVPGSRISLYAPEDDGTPARWYANVVEHVPEVKLVLGYDGDSYDGTHGVISTYSVENKNISLEYYMREWELEG